MKIGVPKEIKNHEYRVGMQPAGVRAMIQAGPEVLVQRSAGTIIGLPNELSRTLQMVQKGDIEIRSADIRDSSRLIYSALNQLIFMILGITSAIFGWIFRGEGELFPQQISFSLSALFLFLMFRSMRRGKKVLNNMD